MAPAEITQYYQHSGVEELLANEAESSCKQYAAVFRRAAVSAETENLEGAPQLLWLLAVVTNADIRRTAPDFPFEPLFFSDDRKIDPVELRDDEVNVLEIVARMTAESLLKARLLDVLWFARHQFRDCQNAVLAYFEAAERGRGSFIHKVDSYRRGIGLARSLGIKSQVFRDARTQLATRTRDIAQREPQGFFFRQMLAIIRDFGTTEQARGFIATALDFATARFAHHDVDGAERYWQEAASLQRKVGDEAGATETDRRLGDCYVRQAEQFATEDPPNFMNAALWMARGVEQLQRSSTDPQRLAPLRIRLQELQRRSLGELRPLELPADLRMAIEEEHEHNRQAVIAAVTGLPLHRCLFRLANGLPLASYPDVRQQLIAGAQEAPLQALIAANSLDARGRTRAVAPGIIGDGIGVEEAIRQRAYAHLARTVWPPRADLIATACTAIWEEHLPFVHDLGFLAHHSPWVVQGHEETLLRGLHAGLYGDWLLSGHLLFAQFEASLRNVMERLGVAFPTLEGGVEEDRTLGALLNHDRCAEIIGADLRFELQAFLIEKNGANFRNNVAHGLLPDAGFYSAPSAICWWLMLRLCCITVPRPTAENQDAG